MKVYSLSELLEQADKHFGQHNVEKLYATSDGQFFLKENRAVFHATNEDLKVFSLTKGDHGSQTTDSGDDDGRQVADEELQDDDGELSDSEIASDAPKTAKSKSSKKSKKDS